MALQLGISREIAAAQVGQAKCVLVEKQGETEEIWQTKMSSWEHGHIRSGEGNGVVDIGPCLIARGEADAPDIDGRVLVRGDLPLGQFSDVRITGHTDYDLIAELAKPSDTQ